MPAPLPLSALAAQSLIAFSRDYDRIGSVPPLPLWANFLRVVPDGGLKRVEAARATRVSRRAVAAIVHGCERAGLVTIDKGTTRGSAVINLTQHGRRAREAGLLGVSGTEEAWRSRFGTVGALRTQLEALVAQLDLELPHFPIGYGPVDNSVTGGTFVPGDDGPPRIPSHGQDWVPVVRIGADGTAELPLPALLSQALVAFAIEFEERGGPLSTAVIFQGITDKGITASELPEGCPSPSGWERHGAAFLDPTPLQKDSRVTLTDPARFFRDRYVTWSGDIEGQWNTRFGCDLIGALRDCLESFVDEAGLADLPHYPLVEWIGGLRDVSTTARS